MCMCNAMDYTMDMEAHFTKRTNFHIGLVRKYLNLISKLDLPHGLVDPILTEEMDHDASKFLDPEYTPYLHVNWKYKLLAEGIKYEPAKEIMAKMLEATFCHVKNNKHHPEYWDDKVTINCLNPKDRDKPSGNMVDATKMPLPYVASMMADWLSLSEEKNTSILEWIRNNVNIRWKFTEDQVALINNIAREFLSQRD